MQMQRQSVCAPGRVGGGGHAVVIGAGVGGLAAAAVLAHEGWAVSLFERDAGLGGKLRRQAAGPGWVDAGPTVFTLRPFFEALWQRLGERLDEHLQLAPLDVLARHAWTDGARLDLHADPVASTRAIAEFAGADEARRFQRFCQRSAQVFAALEQPFMRASRPNPATLVWRAGWRGMPALARIAPFTRLAGALASSFRHPRLRQLFGRYATYCGASPWLSPATLMLIAHAEQRGVWTVEGGMHRLAEALAGMARARGAQLHTGTAVARLALQGGRVTGVVLADGLVVQADAVIFNGDAAALARGLLGPEARRAVPASATAAAPAARSLSAITWTGLARPLGPPLAHHTVLFSDNSQAEFEALFGARRLPAQPTVYLCAQDRTGAPAPAPGPASGTSPNEPTGALPDPLPTPPAERLLCLVNAPACGDQGPRDHEELQRCEEQTWTQLARCGLQLQWQPNTVTRSDPWTFHQRFAGTGGALYGAATHGWQAAFRRPGSQSRLPGLLLAGGSVHPGPGLPMALTSGWLAAEALLSGQASRHSTGPWPAVAMPGGTWTR